MGPWSPTKKNQANLRQNLAILKRAQEIDPRAFKPVMVPHFSDQQLADQWRALKRAGQEAAHV